MEPEYAEEFEDMETNTEPQLAEDGLMMGFQLSTSELTGSFYECLMDRTKEILEQSYFPLLNCCHNQPRASNMARIHFNEVGYQTLMPRQFLTLALMGA